MFHLNPRQGLAAFTAASALGAGLAWTKVVADQWPRLMALSSLCTHSGLLVHCPGCYPAAALTGCAAAGALLLGGGVVRRTGHVPIFAQDRPAVAP